jgi:hypothetical protein
LKKLLDFLNLWIPVNLSLFIILLAAAIEFYIFAYCVKDFYSDFYKGCGAVLILLALFFKVLYIKERTTKSEVKI